MINWIKRLFVTFISWFTEHILEKAHSRWVTKVITADEMQEVIDCVEPLDILCIRTEGWLSTSIQRYVLGNKEFTHCLIVYKIDGKLTLCVESANKGFDVSNLLANLKAQSKVCIYRPDISDVEKRILIMAIEEVIRIDLVDPINYNWSLIDTKSMTGKTIHKIVPKHFAITCSQCLRFLFQRAFGSDFVTKYFPLELMLGFKTITPNGIAKSPLLRFIKQVGE